MYCGGNVPLVRYCCSASAEVQAEGQVGKRVTADRGGRRQSSAIKKSPVGQRFFASSANESRRRQTLADLGMARSERFELPTLGIEIRCSIQLSYERLGNYLIENI
jgi:hypothetical protein